MHPLASLSSHRHASALTLLMSAAMLLGACGGSGGGSSGGGAGSNVGGSPTPATTATATAISTASSTAHAGSPTATSTIAAQIPQAGDVLIAGGVTSGGSITQTAEFFSVTQQKFLPTGSLQTGRAGAEAQWFVQSPERTNDVGVVDGGLSGSATISSSTISLTGSTLNTGEVFSLTNGTFGPAPGTMTNGRMFASSIEFPGNFSVQNLQGHILIVGGICNAAALLSCQSANKQHPDDDRFTTTSNPKLATFMQALTLLNDGTVLLSGGITDFAGTTTNSTELFTPSNEFFTTLSATMTQARAGHTATLLADGTALISGGFQTISGKIVASNTAELFNPSNQTFTAVANMNQARADSTATRLSDGSVLIAGGFGGTASISISGSASSVTITFTQLSGAATDTAEIYNPATKSFACVGGTASGGGCAASMTASRFDHTATQLANGDVLLAGGLDPSLLPLGSAEIFHAGGFAATSPMNHARSLQGAMLVQQ